MPLFILSFPRLSRTILALILLGGSTIAHATIVGLNQIVTPEIQPTGVLAFSAQAQHAMIGNSQELQLELGLTPRLEVAWFQGLTPGEGLFSAEFNLLHQGPNLLTVAAINWSTRGGRPQPVIEYGYYLPADNFVAGAIDVDHHAELLLGYKHVVSDKLQLSADFQAGAANATTIGFTWALTPSLSVNPALYRINSGPHHLLGYLVVTWNIPLWR